MKELNFRPLEASEIEVRVSTVKQSGASLWLYKDARCDMRMLDETVGAYNWECDYQEIRDILYCTVKIFDSESGHWVSKQDCGVSSYTEKEKGEASDAFKRACFKWGIGRELYTSPFIWVTDKNCTIKANGTDKNGKPKFTCYDRFSVKSIKITDGRITGLTVWNDSLNKVAWTNQKGSLKQTTEPLSDIKWEELVSDGDIQNILSMEVELAEKRGVQVSDVHDSLLKTNALKQNSADIDMKTWTKKQMNDAVQQLNVWLEKAEQ